MAKEWEVKCKRCNGIDPATGKPDPKREVRYSGMMYEKIKEYGQSRPEYCEVCRKDLLLEKMTMGAAYFSVITLPGTDLKDVKPGELGKVYHPDRHHVDRDIPSAFDETKFGATPGKIVEIYQWLKHKNHQVAIIIGETGSGKSTALPYWLIYPPKDVPSDFFIRNGQILITQPRIVATTEISKYMGTLLGSSVGKGFDIGYRYSKDRNTDRFNAAFLATDGSLINMILNGQLADLSVVMIDEAHERSENIDIILRLLKDQLPLYPHLKLLVVSATINKELFLNYFGTDTAKIIEFEAKRKFDYQINFASEEEKLPYENPAGLRGLLVPALVKKVVWLLEEQVAGRKISDVVIDREKVKANTLAFLHGVKPIEEAVASLIKAIAENPKLKEVVEVYPLYSDLPKDKRDKALEKPASGIIRVIVSTNVAEASVTVPGVVYVIETGVENQANWKADTLETRVSLTLISQANAKQRWGRSGRTAPGEVYCLYSEEQFNKMVPFPIPAIQRSSMEEIILRLKKLGVDDLADGWIENPKEAELSRSFKSLHASGAIDKDEMLTEYGSMLNEFAYTATLTDLIILSDRFGCAIEVATILPVIKNGGHKYLLLSNSEWDRKESQKALRAHQILWKNCQDDIEFILKLYSLWLNPPKKQDQSGKLSLKERREAWCKEYYVNQVVLEELDEERTKILQLLNSRKKDSNFRDINFKLLNRTRMILAYCLPYKEIPESGYSYNPKLPAETGSCATFQMSLPADKKKVVIDHHKQKMSLLSLARDLLGLEQNSEADDVYARIFAETDLSLEDAISLIEGDWQEKISKEYPLESLQAIKVKSVINSGVFASIEDKVNVFVHVGEINKNTFIKDAAQVIHPGERYTAKVIGYDPERQSIRMTLSIPENSPLKRFKVGQILEGKVVNFAAFGTFVSLGLGNQGLIHISKMGKWVKKPDDLLSIGDSVQVEVISMGEEKGTVRIGLLLKSVLPKT